MKLLWLDDERDPFQNTNWLVFSPIEQPYELIWLKSYGEFTNWITENGLPDAICFDHDLADNFTLREDSPVDHWFDFEENKEWTGMDCAKWLVEYCLDTGVRLPYYNIQSANPVGRKNIDSLLKNYVKYVERVGEG